MEGTSATAFSPDAPVTCEVVRQALLHLTGGAEPEPSPEPSPESDPERVLTRQELAVLLYQCETERFGVPEDGFAPLSRFTDGETVDDDARMAMSWAVGSGLIQGTAGDRLEPEAAASRGQAAVILHRYLLHHGVAAGK